MRSTLCVLAALASTTLAQNVGLPGCAGACLGTGFGGCGRLDVACICNNKSLISNLSCCVKYNCNEQEQKDTIQFAQGICGSSGVKDLPTSASCSPGQEPTGASGASVSVTRTTQVFGGSTGAPSVTSSTEAKTTGSSSSSSSGSSSGGVSQTTSSASSSSASSASSSSSHAAAPTAQAFGLGGLVVAGLIAAL